MRTSNGQGVGLNGHSVNTAVDARNVSKIKVLLTPCQSKFIDFVLFHGVLEFSRSLKMIHDLALYHSDAQLEDAEKTTLYDLKLLWESFERIGKRNKISPE